MGFLRGKYFSTEYSKSDSQTYLLLFNWIRNGPHREASWGLEELGVFKTYFMELKLQTMKSNRCVSLSMFLMQMNGAFIVHLDTIIPVYMKGFAH